MRSSASNKEKERLRNRLENSLRETSVVSNVKDNLVKEKGREIMTWGTYGGVVGGKKAMRVIKRIIGE